MSSCTQAENDLLCEKVCSPSALWRFSLTCSWAAVTICRSKSNTASWMCPDSLVTISRWRTLSSSTLRACRQMDKKKKKKLNVELASPILWRLSNQVRTHVQLCLTWSFPILARGQGTSSNACRACRQEVMFSIWSSECGEHRNSTLIPDREQPNSVQKCQNKV